MMVGKVNTDTNNIQAVRAQQSFENLKKIAQNRAASQKSISAPEEPKSNNLDEINHGESDINKKYMDEIKDFMGKNKLNDVEDDDIKYALRYGTSLLADYKA